ncbi:hypothetical protein L873DRAFT_1845944 [Choiromyces venosus 120613-1]|uniref:Uncharacterized protein n=1 Tax=Choiromyces venosus 120613-1 TaxID=1336337 RepID=A0A3N4JB24_9PEZI|nr:hypothetical protein L873DRAFT_1845944 [Choiromyces venosus 120613-1]
MILNDHDHPFVLVGKYALKWMGVPVYTANIALQIINIPVRTSQMRSICHTLAQSGEWLEVDESSILGLVMMSECGEHRSVRQFKRHDDRWYICLYSKDTYHLTVDNEKVQVPHPINFNLAVVGSGFHPNRTNWRVKPYLIMDQNVKFVWGEPVTFPVFIPSIPEFFNLSLNCMRGPTYQDDDTYHISQIDIHNLARYLVLDLPTQ